MRNGLLRVLVVDDHVGVRNGVASLIDAEQPRMCCVGGAGNAPDALALTRDLQPDVVVLDVLLGSDDGLALIPPLRRLAPCAVVVLTSLSDPSVDSHAARLGAHACLHKAAPAGELIAAIEKAWGIDPWHVGPTPANAAGALSWPDGIKRP
jgi:two-component system nitrate/nitrite response regulator NarL